MIKTLSEQLCELCEIKSADYIVYNKGDYEVFETYKDAEKFAKENNLKVEYNYPDFEKPENNLKLLKIISYHYPTCIYISDIIGVDDLLNFCIDFIREEGFTVACRDEFKQAIREAEWEW